MSTHHLLRVVFGLCVGAHFVSHPVKPLGVGQHAVDGFGQGEGVAGRYKTTILADLLGNAADSTGNHWSPAQQ